MIQEEIKAANKIGNKTEVARLKAKAEDEKVEAAVAAQNRKQAASVAMMTFSTLANVATQKAVVEKNTQNRAAMDLAKLMTVSGSAAKQAKDASAQNMKLMAE